MRIEGFGLTGRFCQVRTLSPESEPEECPLVELIVIGAGYVGAVTAALLASRGQLVTILESDPTKVAAIQGGTVPFFEPGLAELVADVVGRGRLRATDDPAALTGATMVLVCVGTPLSPPGEARLSQVQAACADVARHAPTSVVLMRSTLPLGASEHLAEWLCRQGLAGRATVAMLGLAFKAHTDGTRYSPAIALVRELIARGLAVTAHDPKVPDAVTSSISGLTRVADAAAAIEDADLVVLATEWPEYQGLDWAGLVTHAAQPVLFDGRNALDRLVLARAGWRVIRVGSSTANVS